MIVNIKKDKEEFENDLVTLNTYCCFHSTFVSSVAIVK